MNDYMQKYNHNPKKKEKVIKIYSYCNENRVLCFEKLRYEGKTFSFRQPNLDNPDKPIDNLKGVKPLPYLLPEWMSKEKVIICEGEKDTDAMAALGFNATCAPFGAGSWPDELTPWFKGKIVYICYDIGKEAEASAVAEKLMSVTKTIFIITLPSDEEEYDLSNYISSVNNDSIVIKRLFILAEKYTGGLFLNPTADKIEEKKVDWLAEGRIPFGFVTLIIGDSGVGKSQLDFRLTSHISKGKAWPDNTACPAGKVILMNMVENDQNCITVPALRVCGAEMKNVTIEGIFHRTGEVFNIFKHEKRIRSYLKTGDYRAWFLDILLDYTGGGVDFNKAQQIRPVMNQLNRLAADYHVAVIATLHFGKALDRPAFLRYAGSHQLRAAAKVIYLVGIDPDDPELNPAEKRRFLMPDKNNLAGVWKKSWAFHIRQHEGIGCFEWDEVLEHIIDVNYVVSYSDFSAETIDAMKFILGCLAAAKDYSMLSDDVKRIAAEEGITTKKLYTAKKRLGNLIAYGKESKFQPHGTWQLNIGNYKLFNVLEKYEIKLQHETSPEAEKSNDNE